MLPWARTGLAGSNKTTDKTKNKDAVKIRASLTPDESDILAGLLPVR
tara:strand:- start:81 stop:221 length:141 start_codon:yes stop_codon:yes gene_type:complete